MQWYLKVVKNYVGFQGRARRKEYWMFTLINFIIVMLLTLVDHALNISTWLEGLYTLALLLPGLAVEMRRLHDIGRSGWWIWITLVPIIGIIVLLVFLCQDSNQTENKYGSNPKLNVTF